MQRIRPREPARVAGLLLLAITLLAVIVMAHHPSIGRTPDLATAVQRIATFSQASGRVHGALIAMMLITLWCLTEFAALRGWSRPLIRAGVIAYASGVVVMIGAALVSGFVVTDVALLAPHDTPVDLQVLRALLILCGIVNQACAGFGAIAMSTGIALWSLDLMRDRGVPRLVGLFGILIGLVVTIALPLGVFRLDVKGMLGVVVLQAIWNLAVAVMLIRAGRRGRLP